MAQKPPPAGSGSSAGLRIEPIDEVSEGVLDLAEAARQEGHRHIGVLVEEHASGKNRFQRRGEALLGAYLQGELVGIAGVNVDPYETSDELARVRRLYVLPSARRRGIASRLMREIETVASRHFRSIQLFTDSEAASRFYVELGYSVVVDRYKVSHEKPLKVPESG